MNVKSLMLLLALAGLGPSCSDDEANGNGTSGIAGRSELQIVFSGTGESQSYEKTKAIASAKENRIDDLQIYLFASAAENGPYYYLETWKDGDAAYNPEDVDGATGKPKTNFKKTETGTGWKASLYPNELGGVPYIKLFCIANNGAGGVLASDGATASKTTDGKFYQENGTTEILSTLTAVTTADNGDGTFTVTPGTTEEDFLKSFTAVLGADANGVISTPLLMTGQGKTKISGNVSKVNIDLTRVVARFDIDNTTSKSNLTIKKVTLAQGRKTAPLWDASQITAVAKENLATSDLIAQKYEPIDFEKLNGANQGITESSIYIYPTLPTDESYLILEGTYKSPVNSDQVEVTYHVPIVRTPEGADKGEYISIKANNRYCLRITDVTLSNVFGSFEVVDWTSGGGITIRPDNDAPVFDTAKSFVEGDKPKDLNAANPEASTYDFEVTGDADGKGSFILEIAATRKVRCEKEVMTKAGETDWLNISTSNSEERDGVWYTKFQFQYDQSIGQQPVAVHFINETASYDPALWTTVNFFGPKAVPSFAAAKEGNSLGNTISVDVPKTPTTSLYTVNGSYVTFDITSIEGVEAGTLTGYKAEEITTNGFVHTYKISVSDQTTAAGGNMVFKNAGDPDKTTTLAITKADPSLKFKEITDTDNVGDWVEGVETPYPTTGTLKIDLDALNSYTFRINAPENLTVNGLNCDWLTISESHAWNASDRYIEYTLTKKGDNPSGTDDFKLTFTNKLTESSKGINAPGLDITIHKDFSKPKYNAGTTTASWSTYNTDFAADASFDDPTAAMISMYKFNNSAITVTKSCSEAASFEAVNGLKVDKIGETKEYTIKVTDADQLTAATTELIAHNDGAYATNNSTDRKAKLTITWASPEITVEALATGAVTPTVCDLNITVPSDFKRYTDASFKIIGHKGSTITYPDVTGKWTSFDVSPASIGGAGSATVILLGTADVADTSTISITVHNAVKDEDVTINISKEVAAP